MIALRSVFSGSCLPWGRRRWEPRVWEFLTLGYACRFRARAEPRVLAYAFRFLEPVVFQNETRGLSGWLIVLVAIAGGVFSGAYATTDMWGGRDPGVYMELASNMALQGVSDIDRPELREGLKDYQDIISYYPGTYDHTHPAHDRDDWALMSQFNDLTPAYRAVFFGAFGFVGFSFAVGLFAFASLLMVGLVARNMGGSHCRGDSGNIVSGRQRNLCLCLKNKSDRTADCFYVLCCFLSSGAL